MLTKQKIIVCLISILTCFTNQNALFAQQNSIKQLDKTAFLSLFNDRKPNELVIFNFWSIYCANCRKEMPYFDTLQQAINNPNLKVYLINVDTEKNKTQVLAFIEKYQLNKNQIYFLNDEHISEWITTLSPDLSGTLPLTFFCKPNETKAFEFTFWWDLLYTTTLKNL